MEATDSDKHASLLQHRIKYIWLQNQIIKGKTYPPLSYVCGLGYNLFGSTLKVGSSTWTQTSI